MSQVQTSHIHPVLMLNNSHQTQQCTVEITHTTSQIQEFCFMFQVSALGSLFVCLFVSVSFFFILTTVTAGKQFHFDSPGRML